METSKETFDKQKNRFHLQQVIPKQLSVEIMNHHVSGPASGPDRWICSSGPEKLQIFSEEKLQSGSRLVN